MSQDKPINELIAGLAADLKQALAAPSAAAVDDLEERRYELLSRHLGFQPARTVEPVFVVGDSHTLFFAGEDGLNQVKHRRVGWWRPRYITRGLDLLPCFRTRHLGPATAWRAFDFGSSTRSREKLDALLRHEFEKGTRVLLSYGEIDCRCHLPKAVMSGRPVEAAVQETVERFMRLAEYLQSVRGLNVSVWGPATVTPRAESPLDTPIPVVGSMALRSDIARVYCDCLSHECGRRGVPCVCLAGTYHGWGQAAGPECFCDGFHLSQNLMPQALRALLDIGALRLQIADARSVPAGTADFRSPE